MSTKDPSGTVGSKGSSDYFSHILALAIAIVILSIVAATFHDYYVEKSIQSEEAEAEAVMRKVQSKALGIYTEYRTREMETASEGQMLAETVFDLPEDIGGKNYEVGLNSSGDGPYVFVDVQGLTGGAYNRSMYNVDVDLEGSVTNPGEAKLQYINRKERDLLELSAKGS